MSRPSLSVPFCFFISKYSLSSFFCVLISAEEENGTLSKQTLVRVILETGRKHQIRAQMAHIGDRETFEFIYLTVHHICDYDTLKIICVGYCSD